MSEPKTIAENDWLLAVDKPPGLIAHRDGRTEEPSLSEWLGEKFPYIRGVGGAWVSPQGEAVQLNGLVHRLDRTTSGVLLAAKTEDAFEYLKNEFRARRVEKKYLAWVNGVLSAQDGTIIAEIARSTTPPKRWYARACEQDDVRAAITDWRKVGEGPGATLLELSPKTGRTHQLRVHLAYIGHPIIADHLYAPEFPPILGFNRVALHASSVAVTEPDGKRTTYAAELPEDFVRASATL